MYSKETWNDIRACYVHDEENHVIENNDGQLARENCWPRVGQELGERA